MDDRQLLNARLGELLYLALVDIRHWTYPGCCEEKDSQDRINDLADLLHNMPRFVVGHDEYAMDSVEQFRGAVVEHVRRFHPDIDPTEHRYVQMLDMDAEAFLSRYKHRIWDVPATADAQ